MRSNGNVITQQIWWNNLSSDWQHALADNLEITSQSPSANELAAMRQITELDLSGSAIDDLTPLYSFRELTKLDLSDTKITDLTFLKNLSKLTELHMVCSHGLNVEELACLSGLEVLDISYPVIPLVGSLTLLERLPNLRELFCNACDLTDVIPLIGLESLNTLSLSFNRIPHEEIEALSELSPRCRILF